MTLDEARTTLQQLTQGETIHRDKWDKAIATLEKQDCTHLDFADLGGEWGLLWTSGTQNRKKLPFRRSSEIVHLAQRDRIIQAFDPENHRITNQVSFPLGALCVGGTCRYTSSKRLHFTFSQLALKLGTLPILDLPFGSWATGWLQTTYLDGEYHIERGDRGGVSLYQKLNR